MKTNLRSNTAYLISLTGLNDSQLAELMETTRTSVNRWRNQRHTIGDPAKLGRLFGVTDKDLAFGTETEIQKAYATWFTTKQQTQAVTYVGQIRRPGAA